jgi:2-polyprenyl-6-methoxyphenol hydroxylase-like FAD-dependent oxidoreductase
VGLWTALTLAQAGIEVVIVDRETRTAARSYACALHPRTIKLLESAGLAQAVLTRGRKVAKVAFYEGQERKAEIKIDGQGTGFPYLLILPQSELENLLEQKLKQAGVSVHWNHRFENVVEEEDEVTVAIEELGGTATGYIIPHWEMVVKHRAQVRAQFLVGADGHGSLVGQRLGIEHVRASETERFAAYEFEPAEPGPDEIRVAFAEGTTNVLWPLTENRCRWTFQLKHGPAEFPQKERRAVHVDQPVIDERIRQFVQKEARKRAPWFSAEVKRVTWCSEVAFEHSMAQPFGRNRCWLAGDAAHQTGPAGVQSMNSGFGEGMALSAVLKRVIRDNGSLQELDSYAGCWQNEWHQLLGLTGETKTGPRTDSWVAKQVEHLLPCMPALGSDLTVLMQQLGLVWGLVSHEKAALSATK